MKSSKQAPILQQPGSGSAHEPAPRCDRGDTVITAKYAVDLIEEEPQVQCSPLLSQ